jgi:hypothetical protein
MTDTRREIIDKAARIKIHALDPAVHAADMHVLLVFVLLQSHDDALNYLVCDLSRRKLILKSDMDHPRFYIYMAEMLNPRPNMRPRTRHRVRPF